MHDQVDQLELAQMAIVERVVRPLRASGAYKRKRREELLAHLIAIFNEENAQLGDPQAALVQAAKRFGNPAELASELQSAVPFLEGFSHWAERYLAWRAPESVVRMMLRVSILTWVFTMLATLVPLGLIGVGMRMFGTAPNFDTVAFRTIFAMSLFIPVGQFLIGVCYFKIRDAMWGVFGAKKSTIAVVIYVLLLAISMAACSVATITVMNLSFVPVLELAGVIIITSLAMALNCVLIARYQGPRQIRDTIWACLELKPAVAS